ncbi:MAG TPA: hypothetical protein GX708_01230 [Gallicola sp.]|nr:hypothetical protein [Gallicola sp.]
MIKTIHEVVFDSAGIPDNYNVGILRQGTKNIDQLSMHFESYNDAERVVVIRATRGDGELAPTGLLALPRTDENTGKVWYDFIFGQQENENNVGSWFTESEDNLTLNIQLVDYDEETQKTKVYLTSQISFLIEETSGFEKGSEYTWDIIQGFLNALSLRPTYPYVDNAVNILQAQITSNKGNITNLQNSKVDKTTKVNNKALQSDITLTADDIKGKDALNQEMTIQEVLDSKMDDTQLSQVIDDNSHKAPSNKAVNTVKNILDTKIDNVENTLDTKIDNVESTINQELDTVAYVGALSEEGEVMITVYNADKLGGKTESELSVARAVDSDKLGGKTESELSVASALNSTKLNNKQESQLSVSSAVNSEKLNNKQESELSVASALNSTNANKLNNKTESELNVAKAVDSDKLGGVLASEYFKKSDNILQNAPLTLSGSSSDITLLAPINTDDILEFNIEDRLHYIKISGSGVSNRHYIEIFGNNSVGSNEIGGNTIWFNATPYRRVRFYVKETPGNMEMNFDKYNVEDMLGAVGNNENEIKQGNKTLTIKSIRKVN